MAGSTRIRGINVDKRDGIGGVKLSAHRANTFVRDSYANESL